MSKQLEHHIWCNDYNKVRKGCVQCDRLFKKYPDVRWENVHEKANQYFPGVKTLSPHVGVISE